jgi:hypothetical protein
MKKIIFALIAMATISFASCAGNATNQQATEEETVESVIDSVCAEEPETDEIVTLDSTESEQPTETME